MLLGTLRASLSGNIFLMLPHPLRYKNYHQNKPKLYGVYSRNNLSKIKDGAYVINLDDFKSIGTH